MAGPRAPGRFGVLDLMVEFALTEDEALVVSDYLPVWAVFSAVEGGGGRAGVSAGRASLG